VKQGQCVLFVSYEEHRAAVESAGIPFKSLGPDCIDRKLQSQIDPYASKKAKLLASAALFTGELLPNTTAWCPCPVACMIVSMTAQAMHHLFVGCCLAQFIASALLQLCSGLSHSPEQAC
jgi:hypothetical protein